MKRRLQWFCSCALLCALLVTAALPAPAAAASTGFSDVPESHWAQKYIKNMYFNGIMNGTGKTTFEPDKPLTRAEAATILYRILKMVDERFGVLNTVLNERIK